MKTLRLVAALTLPACLLSSCSEPHAKVAGSMRFILGGTSGSAAPGAIRAGTNRAVAALLPGTEYIVSPRKAKITFTSVNFTTVTGDGSGASTLADCTVTYDRSLASGSTILDCPFTAPVGDITSMQLFYSTTVQLLVSDATVGIYSDPTKSTGYSTTAPSGGAAFVPLTITIGGAGSTTRGLPVFFATPVTIAEGTTPVLYVTVDMIHTVQMMVNADGTTLTAPGTNDPVAVFGGLSPGSSRYYSGAPTAEGYKVQGVPSLRLFYDQAGKPIYSMIGPNFCGVDGGSKGAWSSPPIGATVGGWLGKDVNNVIAWALPTTSDWTVYNAYYVMAEQNTVGQTTVLKCKVTASPPAPADGKTYASGAPVLLNPDKSVTLTLLAK
jgi:hypothetical protein